MGDTGLIERAEDSYRDALDEFEDDWPARHGKIVRKNLAALPGHLQQQRGNRHQRQIAIDASRRTHEAGRPRGRDPTRLNSQGAERDLYLAWEEPAAAAKRRRGPARPISG